MTPFYAYISVLYPDTMEEKISVAEISCGLGFLVGPMIGSAFYALGGYPLPFFVIGTVCLLCSPLLYTILRRSKVYEPIRLDLQGTEDSIATQSEDLEPIGYLKILKHYPSVVYVIS
jgi:MFS family permease